MIYLDNAATSYPKPACVLAAIEHFARHCGGNPGRSGHVLSVNAARVIFEAREHLAELLNVSQAERIIFTKNATEALNIAVLGTVRPGDHVITTGMEHNSVMRPLRALEARGEITLSVASCGSDGTLAPEVVGGLVRGNTRLIVMTHASNVTGTLLPIEEVVSIARSNRVTTLIDAAQTVGAHPINLRALEPDLFVFSGHKGLLGPPGTGGLVIGEGVPLRPLMMGGTGSDSEREEQPDFLPDKFESGTLNGYGIAGLGAGVKFLLEKGVEAVREQEVALVAQLLAGLRQVEEVTVYGVPFPERMVGVVSFNVRDVPCSEVCQELADRFGVLTRAGLHCAPAAHRTIGTFPKGTVRVSLGYSTTEKEIEELVDSVKQIVSEHN